ALAQPDDVLVGGTREARVVVDAVVGVHGAHGREVRAVGRAAVAQHEIVDLLAIGQLGDARHAWSGMLVQPRPEALPYQPEAARVPPSTGIVWPVMNAASSEARNATTPAKSSGRPKRP